MSLPRIRTAVGAAVIVASLAGCTYAAPIPHPTRNPDPGPTEVVIAPTPSAPQEAIAVPTEGETVLGQLRSQRGTNTIGPFPRTTGRMAVYVTCIGAGMMNVIIPGVGSFPVECSPAGEDPGIENIFDVRAMKTLSVEGQGDGAVLWGLTATAIP